MSRLLNYPYTRRILRIHLLHCIFKLNAIELNKVYGYDSKEGSAGKTGALFFFKKLSDKK
jgi:hypothetical protein